MMASDPVLGLNLTLSIVNVGLQAIVVYLIIRLLNDLGLGKLIKKAPVNAVNEVPKETEDIVPTPHMEINKPLQNGLKDLAKKYENNLK